MKNARRKCETCSRSVSMLVARCDHCLYKQANRVGDVVKKPSANRRRRYIETGRGKYFFDIQLRKNRQPKG